MAAALGHVPIMQSVRPVRPHPTLVRLPVSAAVKRISVASPLTISGSISQSVAPKRARSSLDVKSEEVQVESAVVEWFEFICGQGEAFDVVHEHGEGAALLAALRDVLFGKAAATLTKRLSSLKAFSAWCNARGERPFPLRKIVILAYFKELVDTGAAATKAKSCREALAFAIGYFGLQHPEGILCDRQLRGLVLRNLATKRELRQAKPLLVHLVRMLEALMMSDGNDTDKVVAGALLFCVFGRTRFGDLVRADIEPFLDVEGDRGYVEVGMLRHKRAGPAPDRRLPAVASAFGLTEKPWGPGVARGSQEAVCHLLAEGRIAPVDFSIRNIFRPQDANVRGNSLATSLSCLELCKTG